jgi:chromosome segregation ATPase
MLVPGKFRCGLRFKMAHGVSLTTNDSLIGVNGEHAKSRLGDKMEQCYETRMSELRLFLSNRQKELQALYEPLLEKRKTLLHEIEEISRRLELLKRELNEITKAEQAIKGEDEDEQQKGKVTIKQAVLAVLQDAKRAMTAQEILAAINERFFDGKVPRSSLSPQLTRLDHDDQKITYDGTRWSLRGRNEEGPADAEPSFLD